MELFEEAKDLKLKNSRKTLRHNDHVACAINQIIDEKGNTVLFKIYTLKALE